MCLHPLANVSSGYMASALASHCSQVQPAKPWSHLGTICNLREFVSYKLLQFVIKVPLRMKVMKAAK